MQAAFRRSLRVHAKMLRSALAPDPAAPRSPARLARLAALMPPYLAVQTMHWAGFALDELLYAGYRGVRVDQPLFVLGIPRSGTTFVHRTLAADPAFTTLSTWEAVLAPSITERRVWLALAQVDDRLGRPASRLLNRFVRRLAGDFDDIHGVDLTAAEEDYLALIPAAGCFLLALGLPASQDLWGLATFDETLDDADRSILLDFYHALLQKHLYVHGPDRRILSKNAAFASWAPALAARYPEARFLVCVRDPVRAISSQLSSITAARAVFASDPAGTAFPPRFQAIYRSGLRALRQAIQTEPARFAAVDMTELQRRPGATLRKALRNVGETVSTQLSQALTGADRQAADYRSAHAHQIDHFKLDRQAIRREMQDDYDAIRASAEARWQEVS